MKPVYPNSAGSPVPTWSRTPSGNSSRISSGNFPENTSQWAPLHCKFNIGIVGGGIGGVAAAVALHRAGIQATVYERASELREVGAGMMLWPNATRVLKELGLLERVAALSGRNQHFLVRSRTGTILMDIGLGHFDVPALCTRRSDLLDALISALPAERVRLGHEFEYFERQKSSVGIHFSNGISRCFWVPWSSHRRSRLVTTITVFCERSRIISDSTQFIKNQETVLRLSSPASGSSSD
jgi:FAD binding domain